jgi:hypothetical protein
VFVPGLICYAVFSALEPMHEALDRARNSKRLDPLITACTNLLLSLYLVPAEGVFGDAAAWGPAVNFWLGPMLLILGFYGCGVDGVE